MPYRSMSVLPRPVKTLLTPEGQRLYKDTFNHLVTEAGCDEETAAKVAWMATARAGGRKEQSREQRRGPRPPSLPIKHDDEE